ncbi:hypothetical protein C2845_PM01G06350 [Panicum miliaceum]|uniref:Retrotransposon gag domain-containing protein n=1 Tax=Panicum miliaceum TaxID=4540 RepID=A0A3L6THZ1_PANMI|nr:hypothetical protein C2845_PM01G06350 [Panicum miliaceum]
MLAVGSSDLIRHARSRVCILVPIHRVRTLLSTSRVRWFEHRICRSWSFPNSMVITPVFGVIVVTCSFEVFSVSPDMKTRFAALNFKGAAASWLLTYERRERVLDWDTFFSAVFDRFDRDHYQLQLRQLDSLRQTGGRVGPGQEKIGVKGILQV